LGSIGKFIVLKYWFTQKFIAWPVHTRGMAGIWQGGILCLPYPKAMPRVGAYFKKFTLNNWKFISDI
jgi:hypothetical protein